MEGAPIFVTKNNGKKVSQIAVFDLGDGPDWVL
jgi:hypothetical protein